MMHVIFQHPKPTILLVHTTTQNQSHKPKNLIVNLSDMIEIPQSLNPLVNHSNTNNPTIPTNSTHCSSTWGPFFRTVLPAQIQYEVLDH